jgi:hypothetical protein
LSEGRRGAPWLPPDYDKQDMFALKGLAAGTATADQQKHALDYIVRMLCGTYDLSYRPTSERDTVFAEGRRFVGLQLVKLLNAPAGMLDKPGRAYARRKS